MKTKKPERHDHYGLFMLRSKLGWLPHPSVHVYRSYDKKGNWCSEFYSKSYIQEEIDKGRTVKIVPKRKAIADLKKQIQRINDSTDECKFVIFDHDATVDQMYAGLKKLQPKKDPEPKKKRKKKT